MNKLSLFFCGVCALFLLWFAFSWFDVITDNMSENPQHSQYNAFVMFSELWEVKQ